jgi:hypothetical protein
MIVYKLIFQYFRLVLCNNNSEKILKTCKSFFKSNFFIMMEFCNLLKEIKILKFVNLKYTQRNILSKFIKIYNSNGG